MEGGSHVTDLQVALVLMLFFCAMPCAWWLTVKALQSKKSVNTIMAHLVGAITGAGVFFAGSILAFINELLGLLCLTLAVIQAARIHIRLRESQQAKRAPEAETAISNVSAQDGIETAEVIAARARSIHAMKVAANARRADMEARGEKPQQPVFVASLGETGVGRTSRGAKSKASNGKRPGRTRRPMDASVLDVVRFDYLDRDGDSTRREVEVTAASDEYFEGWCRVRRAMRTFRIDRVDGDIISIATGEIANPFLWAAGMLDDGRNKGVDESRWFH